MEGRAEFPAVGESLGTELASTEGPWLALSDGMTECTMVGKPLGTVLVSTDGP